MKTKSKMLQIIKEDCHVSNKYETHLLSWMYCCTLNHKDGILSSVKNNYVSDQ